MHNISSIVILPKSICQQYGSLSSFSCEYIFVELIYEMSILLVEINELSNERNKNENYIIYNFYLILIYYFNKKLNYLFFSIFIFK